jgi:hypothetical protein
MSRLPTPGADKDTWGEILNDYLSQAHKADGTLKDNSVKATTISDNVITNNHISSAAAISQSKIVSLTTDLATKLTTTNNLSELSDKAASRTNLGLGDSSVMSPGQLASHSAFTTAYAPSSMSLPAYRWAQSFQGPQSRFSVMSNPPAITFGGGSSSVNSSYVNGNTLYNGQNAVFTYSGSTFVAGTSAGYPIYTPSHITDANGAKGGGNAPIRVRFMTDATAFDLCFFDSLFGQFNLVVDGQLVARDKTAVFGNTGFFRYIKVDFGADTVTYSKAQTSYSITTGGTGHAIGDIITFNGSTANASGTPLTMKVAQISGSVVTGLDIVNKGAYTTQPSGTFTQVSSTGAGTGLSIGANFFHLDHTTRKMRTIELIYSQPAVFLGLVTLANDVVVPYRVTSNSPKVAFVGDSITNGTYLQYGGAHIGSSIAQKLGWWDKHIISGIGGTGWNAGSTPWSHANRVQDYINYNADIYVFTGSQNDTAGTAMEAKLTSTINSLMAARPNAYVVGIGNILGDSTTLANSIGNGYAAVDSAYQSRLTYINNHTPNKWLQVGAVAQWTVTGDTNHLNQAGMDKFAEVSAHQIANALVTMIH